MPSLLPASILVVEDDPSMRALLALHLSNAGYRLTLAEDAMAAGRHVLQAAPDLMIVDVNLPYLNGLEFVATVMADQTLPDIPVIFITAHEDLAYQAAPMGAEFIIKPFMKERLLESVARSLGKRDA